VNEILRINVSGFDKPGLTSGITQIMAEYGLEILDIGQAVIHDFLTWGILVRIPESQESAPVLKDLLFRMHELQLEVQFKPVSEQEYTAWAEGSGKDRYIVTLLSRQITATQIARVSSITAANGLNIDKINRLSGRRLLDLNRTQDQDCIEFSVRGTPPEPDRLKGEFLLVASELNADIAFQRDDIFRRNRRLVVFDMDSTLIEAEVIDELAKVAGVGAQVAAITERTMQGELDFTESLRHRVGLLKGLPETALLSVANRLKLTDGAEKLISNLRMLGYKTAILSGGFSFFARQLQHRLGIDYVFANELEISQGVVTGKVTGTVVDGTRKAQLLQEIAEKEGIRRHQVIAVGDGANDLQMLSAAGLGIAFRAKPTVKKSAEHAISNLGLDSILYLLGLREIDTALLTEDG